MERGVLVQGSMGPRDIIIGGIRFAMGDDCWSILALENVNSLAASIALKEEFKERSEKRRGCLPI